MKKAKFSFIHTFKDRWSIALMCKVLKVSRQGYYQWKARPLCAHDVEDQKIVSVMVPLWHKLNSCYGAPKMTVELKRQGFSISQKRVARLMRDYGLKGMCGKGLSSPRTKKTSPEKASSQDLVRREFFSDGPNQVWFSDITYVKTYDGWLYVAVVIDIWSRMIVGWAMGPRIDASLADDALMMAITRRGAHKGCIHHSDHGAQYRSLLLGKTMKRYGIVPSMGSIASPWDNAPSESFMSILKRECIHRKTFATREEAQLEIFHYIECFYNKLRLHSALGYMSPEQFEQEMTQKGIIKKDAFAA